MRPGHAQWFVLMVLLFAVLGPQAAAQREVQPEAEDRPARAERAEPDPQRLRAMLERRLSTIEQQEQRLREIIERLDAGESPAEVFAELRERGELGTLGLLAERAREGQRPPRAMAGRGGQARNPDTMSDEDFTLWRNRIMAFFEEHAPEMADRLREAKDSDEARRAVFRLRREVERLIKLRERDAQEFRPALQRLRNGMRIADVLGRVRRAVIEGELTEAQLAPLRRELTEIVAKQYDAQLAARRIFLERTSRRLEHARETFERERTERDERIEAEVQTMLDRAMRGADDRERPGGRR